MASKTGSNVSETDDGEVAPGIFSAPSATGTSTDRELEMGGTESETDVEMIGSCTGTSSEDSTEANEGENEGERVAR